MNKIEQLQVIPTFSPPAPLSRSKQRYKQEKCTCNPLQSRSRKASNRWRANAPEWLEGPPATSAPSSPLADVSCRLNRGEVELALLLASTALVSSTATHAAPLPRKQSSCARCSCHRRGSSGTSGTSSSPSSTYRPR